MHHVENSVRGRSKSVGRGRFLATDRPVDFVRPTKNDRNKLLFPVIFGAGKSFFFRSNFEFQLELHFVIPNSGMYLYLQIEFKWLPNCASN